MALYSFVQLTTMKTASLISKFVSIESDSCSNSLTYFFTFQVLMEDGLIGLRGLHAVRNVSTTDEELALIQHPAPAADTASDSISKPGIVQTDFAKVRSP